MNIAILGGTRGMGRAVARRFAERGENIFLLGRHENDLEACIEDLRARSPQAQMRGHAVCDLSSPQGFAEALEIADQALGGLECVVVTAGIFATQDALEEDSELTERLLTVDFTNTVLFCEEARKRLLENGGGHLCVFSSVAGERGRKPVVLYGASKAGLSRYLEGLDHKFRAEGLKVTTVKPGFVHTGMTAGLKPPPFAGDPDEVAAQVVPAIYRGAAVVYAPLAWQPVMAVIRHLPRFVMRRVGF